ADAIALAAARDLPDANAATATGQSYAAKNKIPWSTVTFVVTPVGPGNPNPKVSVDIKRPHGFVFIKALGVGSADVGAHAASIKTTPGGVGDLMPWSVKQSDQQAALPGQPIVLKYDA